MPSRSAPAMPAGDRPSRQSFPWCTSKQLVIHQLLRDLLRRGSTAARLVQPHTAPAHASSSRARRLPCCQVPPRRWVLLRDLRWGAVCVSHSDPRLCNVRCVSLLSARGSFLPRDPFLSLLCTVANTLCAGGNSRNSLSSSHPPTTIGLPGMSGTLKQW